MNRTGSTAVGREIGALCGRYLQSPCLELGGKNPMVVWSDADIDLAVQGSSIAKVEVGRLGGVWHRADPHQSPPGA